MAVQQDFVGKNGVMGYHNRQKWHRYKRNLIKVANAANERLKAEQEKLNG